MEPERADPETAAAIIESADMDGPLIGWQEDGHSVELIGIDTVDGSEAFKLEVTANGSTSLYYLHAVTYLPIRIDTSAGSASEITRLSDYRDVGGLMFPFSIALQTQQMVLNFEVVEINVPIEESAFSMEGR